ncbi:MAG: 3-dehydroquinate synthase [Coriobacteriales bacterium]|jgi:3-dehydroquinate synthase|nr:3-dehydroquinate synthase [Coriobacteriales bacterium]
MGTQRLKVVLGRDDSYDIRVGEGLFDRLGAHLREVTEAKKAVIVTDSNVAPHYLGQVRSALAQEGFEPFDLTVAAGEASKGLAVAAELWDALALLGIGRDGLLVALGGGVIGDLAGFVASTYMRGIDFVQLPTSLLAMVDSSVGGKTALNLDGGKNLVGTFKQPAYVTADLKALGTLPAEEWGNGFAEIAKSAFVDGGEFLSWLDGHADALAAQDGGAVQQAVVRSLAFKARIVASDEKEKGVRECLNYGHTFGHALEAVSGYRIPHGRAVAEGMRFAARLAVEAARAPAALADAQDALLDRLGLGPVTEPFAADDLYGLMLSDKKVRNGGLRFVLLASPGAWEAVAVDPDLVKIYLILWEQARMGKRQEEL